MYAAMYVTVSCTFMHAVYLDSPLWMRELYTLTAGAERRIQTCEQKYYRKLLCISYREHTHDFVRQQVTTYAREQEPWHPNDFQSGDETDRDRHAVYSLPWQLVHASEDGYDGFIHDLYTCVYAMLMM